MFIKSLISGGVIFLMIGIAAFFYFGNPFVPRCQPDRFVFQTTVNARNFFTREVREFGTYCNVPWGWERLSYEEEARLNN